jgi:phosphatidylserine/phosphatidylglycerophosphate/cardiolipin synthase-like enzyme
MDPTLGQQAKITKYLARRTGLDSASPGETPPAQGFVGDLTGNQVDWFINGNRYFSALDQEIDALLTDTSAGRYFYLSAWWLGLTAEKKTAPVKVVPASGVMAKALGVVSQQLVAPWQAELESPALTLPVSGKPLAVRLQELHQAGVDVRVLAWVSPFAGYNLAAFSPAMAGINKVNLHTLLGIRELRRRFGSTGTAKVVANLASHPLGAAHCKLVVCGSKTATRAFTGGIDPVENRKSPGWHDVAVRLTGPAATGVYDFFRQLWAEQAEQPKLTFNVDGEEIPSRPGGWTAIPEPPKLAAGDGRGACVQVLRTVPQMNFSVTGPEWLPGSALQRALITTGAGLRKAPVSFAPDGCFEFKVALQKAISQAENYIFIADQAFTSQEIMDWIAVRLRAKPDLKVILLHGGDPADQKSGDLPEAINRHLIPGLSEEKKFTHSGIKGVEFWAWSGVTVHCKVTIIDDVFCIVGSANAMRRSLYTDVELSVAILDSTGSGLVSRLRRDLWTQYCGITDTLDPGYGPLLDIDKALSLWSPFWGKDPGTGTKLLDAITGQALPLPVAAAYSEKLHDLADSDSRKTF